MTDDFESTFKPPLSKEELEELYYGPTEDRFHMKGIICFFLDHQWGKWEHAKYIKGGEQRMCQRCHRTQSAQPRLRPLSK